MNRGLPSFRPKRSMARGQTVRAEQVVSMESLIVVSCLVNKACELDCRDGEPTSGLLTICTTSEYITERLHGPHLLDLALILVYTTTSLQLIPPRIYTMNLQS